MLLSANEVIVTPGGFRLFDFVSLWLELRSIERPPSLSSTIYAVITLAGNGNPVQADTNGFTLEGVSGYAELHKKWRGLSAQGKFEQSFLEFILRYLRSEPGISLEFRVQNERMQGFVINLSDQITLAGRFPQDIDVLSAYFESIQALQD